MDGRERVYEKGRCSTSSKTESNECRVIVKRYNTTNSTKKPTFTGGLFVSMSLILGVKKQTTYLPVRRCWVSNDDLVNIVFLGYLAQVKNSLYKPLKKYPVEYIGVIPFFR